MKRLGARLLLLVFVCSMAALASAEIPVVDPNAPEGGSAFVLEGTLPFVYQNRVLRNKQVSYYPDVWAVNHGDWALTPFDASVPEDCFVQDEMGYLAIAPEVMEIVDAIRFALYQADVGEVGLLYGQYTEQRRSKDNRLGYSGIHEGIDFIAADGQQLHAILPGTVLRSGKDKDGTVAIYHEETDTTILYLHCRKVQVKNGDQVVAGQPIAQEGDKGSEATYSHIEVRFGKHYSPNPYRNATLQSNSPYEYFRAQLQVDVLTDRAALTYANVHLLEQQHLEAEAERVRLSAQEASEQEAARLSEEQRLAREEEERIASEEEARLEAERIAQEEARQAAEELERRRQQEQQADTTGATTTTEAPSV